MTSAAATRDKPNNAIGREREGRIKGGWKRKKAGGGDSEAVVGVM